MSAAYSFYALTTSPIEKALPPLLEKVIASGKRAVVVTENETRRDALDGSLWTYHPGKFLPHGTKKDPFPEDQPIFVSEKLENPNKADVLVLAESADASNTQGFSRIIRIFDSASESQRDTAIKQLEHVRAEGNEITCWKQESTGWVKAETL